MEEVDIGGYEILKPENEKPKPFHGDIRNYIIKNTTTFDRETIIGLGRILIENGYGQLIKYCNVGSVINLTLVNDAVVQKIYNYIVAKLNTK